MKVVELKDHNKRYMLWHIPLLLIPISLCSGAIYWSLSFLELNGFDKWADGRYSGLLLFLSAVIFLVLCVSNILKNLYRFIKHKKVQSGT